MGRKKVPPSRKLDATIIYFEGDFLKFNLFKGHGDPCFLSIHSMNSNIYTKTYI